MLNALKPYLLRLHRWVTLVFALPLAVVTLTGLILAFEPVAIDLGFTPGSINAAHLSGLLAQYDPGGKTSGISLRAYEDRLTLNGPGVSGKTDIALSSGAVVDDSVGLRLSALFMASRRLHEHFLFDQGWVVLASTFAMLALILLGIVMGWPRLRNTVSGWHQGMAWFALPLVVLSPLTGLALAYKITLSAPPPQNRAAVPTLAQAVEILGQKHDLSGLIWLRKRGPAMMARINEGGAFRVYRVSQTGVQPMGANWPRSLHEGNFAGVWSGLMVIVTAMVIIGLMVTGLIIYFRRLLRPRNRNRATTPVAAE